jgi:dTDP-4-dehydrorhamnose 3,5-epimerase
MKLEKFAVEGPLLLTPRVFGDDRGFFQESWNAKAFADALAEAATLAPAGFQQAPVFVQDNHSRSTRGVLRGLHMQVEPHPQAKLVRCVVGEIFDVAVDLRANSPTFGKYQSVVLSGDKPSWFWVPAGFAHVFLNIGQEDCEVMYKVNALYSSKGEACIYWKDEDLKIAWPVTQPLCSEKDQKGGRFQDYMKNPNFT